MQQMQQQGSPAGRFPSPGGAAAAAGGFDAYGGGGAGVPGGDQSMAALVHRLRSFGSEMMAADEINYILRIQHMATHGGHPYLEDFYYQVCISAMQQQHCFNTEALGRCWATLHRHGCSRCPFDQLLASVMQL
jgi:hypothetical protein